MTLLTRSWGVREAAGDSDPKEVPGGQRGQEGAGQRRPREECSAYGDSARSARSAAWAQLLPHPSHVTGSFTCIPWASLGYLSLSPQPHKRSTLVQDCRPLRPGSSLSFPTCPVEKVIATFPAHQVAVGTYESVSRSCPRPGEELHEDPQRRPGPAVALLLWPACLSHAGTNLRGALLTQHPATSTAACVGRSVPSGVTQHDPQRGCRTGGPLVIAEGISIWGPPVHSVILLCPHATGPVFWGSEASIRHGSGHMAWWSGAVGLGKLTF